MKRYIIMLAMAAALVGCDYLDKMPDDQKTDEMVWTNRTEVLKYLTNCYSALRQACRSEQDPWIGIVDDIEISSANLRPYGMARGDWSPTSLGYPDRWSLNYKAIRATFVFEQNIDRCKELSEDLKTRYVGESIFLRGYYYFDLLRLYGPVVLLRSLPSNSADFANMPRTPFDECISNVVECMDRAEAMLPTFWPADSEECGHATKVACRAVKAQALTLCRLRWGVCRSRTFCLADTCSKRYEYEKNYSVCSGLFFRPRDVDGRQGRGFPQEIPQFQLVGHDLQNG